MSKKFVFSFSSALADSFTRSEELDRAQFVGSDVVFPLLGAFAREGQKRSAETGVAPLFIVFCS